METYVEYDICVNKKTYHVTVSEEHTGKNTAVMMVLSDKKNMGLYGKVMKCRPDDEFNVDTAVKIAVKFITDNYVYSIDDKLRFPIWHGFRRAQWHKLHDVNTPGGLERVAKEIGMPETHIKAPVFSPETIAGIQKMVNSIENAFKLFGDSEGKKPVGFMHVDTPAGLTVSDGKITLDNFHRIDTDDDGWISVEERLPEALGDIYRASIDVEAKDKDGAIYPRAWCVVNKNDHWYGSWSIGNEDGTSGKSIFYITHWRPMRGDK